MIHSSCVQAGAPALSFAAQLGHTDIVKYLFENTTARAQINVKDIVSHSYSSIVYTLGSFVKVNLKDTVVPAYSNNRQLGLSL